MKIVMAVMMMCLLASLAYGQVPYTVEVARELDADGVAVNYVAVPSAGWAWKMDADTPTERELLLRKPAPIAGVNSLIIHYVVDVPPDEAPPGAGAWWTMIIDLGSINIEMPSNSSYITRCWPRYKFEGVDFSEPSLVRLEKKQAGRGVVVQAP